MGTTTVRGIYQLYYDSGRVRSAKQRQSIRDFTFVIDSVIIISIHVTSWIVWTGWSMNKYNV